MFGIKRPPAPTTATKVGWVLVAILVAVALIPEGHLVKTVGLLIVGLVAFFYLWWVTTASQVSKTIRVPIRQVGSDTRDSYRRRLQQILGDLGDVREIADDGGGLLATVRTRHDLATVRRRIKKGMRGLELRPIDVEGDVQFSAMSASGEAVVEVSGQVPPHALVHIDGLSEPISADDSGRFKAKIPWAVAKKAASHGNKIKATYDHSGKTHRIEIDL